MVWFVVGGGLLVLAPIVFGAALFLTLRPLAQEDAVLAADGSPHQVELPRGEERGLFAEDLATSCVVVDGSGAAVDLRPTGGDFTWNEWTAVGRFSTADGDLTFTCTGASAASQVRIGELPSTGGLLGGIAATILLPLLLGLTGLVVLIVTAVLWATGAPRDRGA